MAATSCRFAVAEQTTIFFPIFEGNYTSALGMKKNSFPSQKGELIH